MKFLSARHFQPLAFLGLMLVMATALPTSRVRREDFTEDTTPNRPVYTTSQQVEGLITRVLKEILQMSKELCNNNPDCMTHDDALSENNLDLPVIERNDGCFQTGYDRENCLLKITSGLLDYQIYLEFLKNNVQDNKKERARVIQNSTKALNQILKQEVKDPGKTATPSPTSKVLLMEKLESQKDWPRTKTIQLILKALEEFLKITMRSTRQN
ncbi:interleukin-6 [Sigmodon hispidus]|uniref:Interleukin-6 n=1 Tax=Sigmodon hispidus TaxID=42415 RepID=Q91ZL3_SIGHI|nr:interleukin 6 precursor [Sigmodon hispidus]